MVSSPSDETTKPPANSSGERQSPLSEGDWERLLFLVRTQQLIPVIGPDVLRIQWQENSRASLYELWGRELAKHFELELSNEAADIPLLYWVSDQLSERPAIPVGDLEYELTRIIDQKKWAMPQALLQLAEINKIPLFISTTIDRLMEGALISKRGEVEKIIFKRNGGLDNDIPDDFSPSSIPIIVHLFGESCAVSGSFAMTEDDLIEFSWSLVDHEYAPKNLYDYLQKKHLLLLGCDFPDWLDRFFIHALSHDQESKIGIHFVSERCPKGLQAFLRRKKARPFIQCSPDRFIAELHQRWLKTEMDSESSSLPGAETIDLDKRSSYKSSKSGCVFISYARDDKAKAIAIRDQLEANNIDTWMDSDLDPGEAYEDTIHENIRNASHFIALISKSINVMDSERLGRYVLKEWRWAADADSERLPQQKFLLPVALDDTTPKDEFIFGPLRDRHWTICRDGRLPRELINFLREGVRRSREK